jgi:hypothetical protein
MLTLDKSPPFLGLLPPQGGGVELDQVTSGLLALGPGVTGALEDKWLRVNFTDR